MKTADIITFDGRDVPHAGATLVRDKKTYVVGGNGILYLQIGDKLEQSAIPRCEDGITFYEIGGVIYSVKEGAMGVLELDRYQAHNRGSW